MVELASTFLQLAILFVFIFCGFLIGKWKRIPADKSHILSLLLVNIFLPCKIFLNFSERCTLPYLKANYPTLLISVGILLLLVLLSKLLSKLLTKDPYEKRVYRYSFAISNYAYLGYVFVEAVFGQQALTDMILFCIPFAFYTYTFGFTLLSAKEGSPKSLINPMVISILLGTFFGVLGISLPAFLITALGYASGCAGPVSMVLTGLVIASFPLKALIPDAKTFAFCAIRLALIPALLFLVCKLLDLSGWLPTAVYPAAVIMGAMPCGLNTIVFPMLAGKDCKMGARFILLSHVLCLITIPVWIQILT